MARHWFGQTLTDWSMTLGEQTEIETEAGAVKVAAVSAAGPKAITFWNAVTGGTQYSDLLDASGTPITQVMTADGTSGLPIGTIPRFQGPDAAPEVTEMWADAGGGTRYLMAATDLGEIVTATAADLESANAQIQALQDALAVRLPAIQWDQASGSYPPRTPDLAGMRVEWVGPSVPPVAATHAIAGDRWAKTAI